MHAHFGRLENDAVRIQLNCEIDAEDVEALEIVSVSVSDPVHVYYSLEELENHW